MWARSSTFDHLVADAFRFVAFEHAITVLNSCEIMPNNAKVVTK